MVTSLSDIVRYQHEKVGDLKKPVEIDKVRWALAKLQPLETDIIKCPEANIDFMASGNIMISGMPPELAEKVSYLLQT